mmetsp:Transcript_8207/g.13747  ORF Transcript_8207/g.13747 Transcript_8207/m.13747 type:complete len:282 (+) Transcript_8207:579-1424(+)
MTALESLRCCLFCNKKSDGVKKCLDHMRIKHSFVILDVDCLIDLKGLLSYIAQRIQLGQLCLFCSKQFKDPLRCQQHMMDKGHCHLNMEDEDEYVDFYDFSKTYENHPLLIKDVASNAIEEAKVEEEEKDAGDVKTKKKKRGEDEDWEDCDFEDIVSEEERVDTDQQSTSTKKEFQIVSETESFSEVNKVSESGQSFSIVDKTVEKGKGDDTSSAAFGIESVSSIQGKAESAKKGLTREEVFLGLNIKKAELLSTGEVRLGNGKLMGHRQWKYLYKQKPKP